MAKLSSTVIYGDLQVDGEIKNKATTETEGVVLLSDEVNNTSTSQGATANSVKKVNDSLSSHKTDTTSHITASERTTWNGKANASHGNHVPTTQTANNAIFLRNDNTWATVTPSNIGAISCSADSTLTSGKKIYLGSTGNYLLSGTSPELSGNTNIIIHADNDKSTTTEYISIKAGHNELKIVSSGGGATVTQGQDKLTFNGNKVYHVGNKPTPADIGASPTSHTHSYLPLSGGTMTGGLTAKNLVLTDYGTPFECSKYIDFHEIGSVNDYDGRLYISGGSLLWTSASNSAYTMNIPLEINNLKSSVSNGKQEIATAITGKGISASGSDTFTTLSTKISSIQVGVNTSDATAIASNLLSGKTAYVNGTKITGTMVNRGAISTTLSSPGSYYTIPIGYHSGTGKISCSSSLYSYSTVNSKLANLFYYTLHYAFDSWLIMQNPSFSTELLDGAVQSGVVKRVTFSTSTTLYLEGYQPLFIYGGGKVSSHGGILNDECGNGSSYVGYFFDDIDEEYVVNLTNNGSTCYYYILNI